ncbi:MAG: M56 family metallopeptidase [Gemmatimonas sp.]
MIAAWMLGSTVFALLLCVAAFAIERVMRLTGRPTRTPWVLALALAVVWPLMAPLVLAPRLKASAGIPLVLPGSESSPAAMIAAQLPSQSAIWEQRAATLLLVVWGVLSALMLWRLLMAARELSRVTRLAKRVQVDGESVLVTESLGPAVIGLWTPSVAVPEWFLQLDASLREMVLRHEREHCKSRDPQLVWLASLSVALMPWNIGAWILSRRLRLALEIDCDARTLGHESDSIKYSRLLLLIAQRQSSYPLAAMLAESTSHLSRRIRAMQMTPLKKPVVRVVLFTGIATGALVVACSPRIASDLTGPGQKPVSATAAKLEAEKMGGGTVYFESQVELPVSIAPGSIGPKYPADLKAQSIEGNVLAMFVVDEQGMADVASFKIVRTASNPEFEAAVRAALPTMRFVPAKIGGRSVKQLVQQPFSFAVNRGQAPLSSAEIKQFGDPNSDKYAAERATIKQGTASRSTESDTKLVKPQPHIAGQPYFESQVEVPVSIRSGYKGPEYPAELKAKRIEGTVLAIFVVNENGQADMSSFKVLKSNNDQFAAAVREAVSKETYTPALIGGVAVKQLVQQPFSFSLSR